jgi:predicted nuclease of restriction endonuclease-like (RecB) superfamily
MVLLDTCPDVPTSEFYAARAAEEGWTRGVLQAMIASRLHERVRPALTTFDHTVPEAEREALQRIVKDPYVLDFLANGTYREYDLRKALVGNLVRLLRELGAGFAFVGSEVPVMCGDGEFFIDVLFYHYRLHRFVVFELKVDRFKPQDVGQLNFNVQLVDERMRDMEIDEQTVGILLVVGRDDVKVQVALRGISTPLAVSEWRQLPPEVRAALPSTDDLSRAVTQAVREVDEANHAADEERLYASPELMDQIDRYLADPKANGVVCELPERPSPESSTRGTR